MANFGTGKREREMKERAVRKEREKAREKEGKRK